MPYPAIPKLPHTISNGHKYVTVLDAGSSGTRIYVYRYAVDDEGTTIIPLELTIVHEHKVTYESNDPGILYPSTQVSSLFKISIRNSFDSSRKSSTSSRQLGSGQGPPFAVVSEC